VTSTDSPPVGSKAPSHWRPPALRWSTIAVVIVLFISALVAILYAFDLMPIVERFEVTDNAYIKGRTTVIAPQVSGYVVAVRVTDYANVRQGQTLVLIDDSVYKARADQARANLAAAISTLANNQQAKAAAQASLSEQSAILSRAKADAGRTDDLVKDGSVSIRERDQTTALLKQAIAQVEIAHENIRTVDVNRGQLEAQVGAARAALDAALIDLAHCVIRAPESGQVGEVGVRLGQYVTNGSQLMSLVPFDLWVIANYKEAQTAYMRLGQKASFRVDALAGRKFFGWIERLSPAAGSEFSVLKPDNATGNFIKVPQRIGVRIAIDPRQPEVARLKPGMSVISRIDTGD
jgi:multidrug resistance efflux pump